MPNLKDLYHLTQPGQFINWAQKYNLSPAQSRLGPSHERPQINLFEMVWKDAHKA